MLENDKKIDDEKIEQQKPKTLQDQIGKQERDNIIGVLSEDPAKNDSKEIEDCLLNLAEFPEKASTLKDIMMKIGVARSMNVFMKIFNDDYQEKLLEKFKHLDKNMEEIGGIIIGSIFMSFTELLKNDTQFLNEAMELLNSSDEEMSDMVYRFLEEIGDVQLNEKVKSKTIKIINGSIINNDNVFSFVVDNFESFTKEEQISIKTILLTNNYIEKIKDSRTRHELILIFAEDKDLDIKNIDYIRKQIDIEGHNSIDVINRLMKKTAEFYIQNDKSKEAENIYNELLDQSLAVLNSETNTLSFGKVEIPSEFKKNTLIKFNEYAKDNLQIKEIERLLSKLKDLSLEMLNKKKEEKVDNDDENISNTIQVLINAEVKKQTKSFDWLKDFGDMGLDVILREENKNIPMYKHRLEDIVENSSNSLLKEKGLIFLCEKCDSDFAKREYIEELIELGLQKSNIYIFQYLNSSDIYKEDVTLSKLDKNKMTEFIKYLQEVGLINASLISPFYELTKKSQDQEFIKTISLLISDPFLLEKSYNYDKLEKLSVIYNINVVKKFLSYLKERAETKDYGANEIRDSIIEKLSGYGLESLEIVLDFFRDPKITNDQRTNSEYNGLKYIPEFDKYIIDTIDKIYTEEPQDEKKINKAEKILNNFISDKNISHTKRIVVLNEIKKYKDIPIEFEITRGLFYEHNKLTPFGENYYDDTLSDSYASYKIGNNKDVLSSSWFLKNTNRQYILTNVNIAMIYGEMPEDKADELTELIIHNGENNLSKIIEITNKINFIGKGLGNELIRLVENKNNDTKKQIGNLIFDKGSNDENQINCIKFLSDDDTTNTHIKIMDLFIDSENNYLNKILEENFKTYLFKFQNSEELIAQMLKDLKSKDHINNNLANRLIQLEQSVDSKTQGSIAKLILDKCINGNTNDSLIVNLWKGEGFKETIKKYVLNISHSKKDRLIPAKIIMNDMEEKNAELLIESDLLPDLIEIKETNTKSENDISSSDSNTAEESKPFSTDWFNENPIRKIIVANKQLLTLFKIYDLDTADNLSTLIGRNPNHTSFFLDDAILGQLRENYIKTLATYVKNAYKDLEPDEILLKQKEIDKKITNIRDLWVNNNYPDAWKSAEFATLFLDNSGYADRLNFSQSVPYLENKSFKDLEVEEKKLVIFVDSIDSEIRSGSNNMKNFLEAIVNGERKLYAKTSRKGTMKDIVKILFKNINIYQEYLTKNNIQIENLKDEQIAKHLLIIMKECRENAQTRNVEIYKKALQDNTDNWKIIMPKESLLHGGNSLVTSSMLDNGFRCDELLGLTDTNITSGDVTPFDFDTSVQLEDSPDINEFHKSIAWVYGDAVFVFQKNQNSFREGREVQNTEWGWWAKEERFRGVRSSLSSNECSSIILKNNFSSNQIEKLKKDIARGGFYIPIFKSNGDLLEDWTQEKFEFLQQFYYDLRLKDYSQKQVDMIYTYYEKVKKDASNTSENPKDDKNNKVLFSIVNDIVQCSTKIKEGNLKNREALLFDSLLFIKNHESKLLEQDFVQQYESRPQGLGLLKQLYKIRNQFKKIQDVTKQNNFETIFNLDDKPELLNDDDIIDGLNKALSDDAKIKEVETKNARTFLNQLQFLKQNDKDINKYKKIVLQIITQEDIDNQLIADFYDQILDILSRTFFQEIANEIDSKYIEKISFVGTGSVGRGDVVIGSDIDYAVYIDDSDMTDIEKSSIKEKINTITQNKIHKIIESELSTIADGGKEKQEQTPVLFLTDVENMKIDLSKLNSRVVQDRQQVEPTTVIDSKAYGNKNAQRKCKEALLSNENAKQNFAEYMFNDLYKNIKNEGSEIIGYKLDWDRMFNDLLDGYGIRKIKFHIQRPMQFKLHYLIAEAHQKNMLKIDEEFLNSVNTTEGKINILQKANILSEKEGRNILELNDTIQNMRIQSELMNDKGYDTNRLSFKDFSRLIYLIRYYNRHIIAKGVA